ncbi:hypothetical protein POTOM_032525 [Populus tomentosa]|uniref:Uncharacterized protein n=1 Tax=Populus tomentosa TaxID=118781 RepID=A0A8X7ZEV1_POPTO|nr:hypothetical protein POTOM_032525 [Populus tomentosa]
MSSSDSNSSSVDDPNPNPKPLDYQFETLNLEQGSGSTIIQNDDDEEGRQQDQGSSLNGSLNVNSNNHEQDDRIGLVRSVVLRRTNSEVEVGVNGPSSPSSSGYAGERGSSGVSEDDEIQEVAIDSALHEVFDSQAAWLPGKRHVDELMKRKRAKQAINISQSLDNFDRVPSIVRGDSFQFWNGQMIGN